MAKRPTLDPTEHPRPHVDVPMKIFGEPLFNGRYDLVGKFVHHWCHAVWKKDPKVSGAAGWLDEKDLEIAILTGFIVRTRGGKLRLTGPNKDPQWLLDVRKRWWTYAIEAIDQGLVKIGHTIHIDKRLDELQVASPHPLRMIGHIEADVEKRLHRALRPWWRGGEWFDLNDETRLIIFAELEAVTP